MKGKRVEGREIQTERQTKSRGGETSVLEQ